VDANQLNDHVAKMLRECQPEHAQEVIQRGNIDLSTARNPSAMIQGRIKEIKIDTAIRESRQARILKQRRMLGDGRQDTSLTTPVHGTFRKPGGQETVEEETSKLEEPDAEEEFKIGARQGKSANGFLKHASPAAETSDMLLQRPQTPPRTAPGSENQVILSTYYRVDNSFLKKETEGTAGLAYRLTPNLNDKDGFEHAEWGRIVYGSVIQENGFVKVGERYLPVQLGGQPVLVRVLGHPPPNGAVKQRRKKEGTKDGTQGATDESSFMAKSKCQAKPKFRVSLKPAKVEEQKEEADVEMAGQHTMEAEAEDQATQATTEGAGEASSQASMVTTRRSAPLGMREIMRRATAPRAKPKSIPNSSTAPRAMPNSIPLVSANSAAPKAVPKSIPLVSVTYKPFWPRDQAQPSAKTEEHDEEAAAEEEENHEPEEDGMEDEPIEDAQREAEAEEGEQSGSFEMAESAAQQRLLEEDKASLVERVKAWQRKGVSHKHELVHVSWSSDWKERQGSQQA